MHETMQKKTTIAVGLYCIHVGNKMVNLEGNCGQSTGRVLEGGDFIA